MNNTSKNDLNTHTIVIVISIIGCLVTIGAFTFDALDTKIDALDTKIESRFDQINTSINKNMELINQNLEDQREINRLEIKKAVQEEVLRAQNASS